MSQGDSSIPPPPEKPKPDECCGSGCVPCVYDFYFEQYERWQEQYGEAYKLQKDTITPAE